MEATGPMTRVDFAARLEHFAAQVRAIRGLSHTNPHAFVEDKSDLAAAMLAEAKALRTAVPPPVRAMPTASISTGVRTIGRARREVAVVARHRRP